MASIKEVAEKASVSIATVSRYFRGTAKVSSETADKIRNAAAELNYIPDFFASSLKCSHSNQICLLLDGIRNLFFNDMTENLEKAFQTYNYHLMLMLTYGSVDILKKHIQNSLSMRASAFLYIPNSNMAEYYNDILKSDTYALQLFLDIDRNVDSVTVDDAYGTELAVNYFIEKGYKDVIMLDYANENFFKNRTRGFVSAFEKHGLTPPYENLCVVNNQTVDTTIENILDKHNRPAILAVANEVGTSVIKHVYERGLKFKKDLGLIIYDDMEIAQIMNITCIGHNRQEITDGIISTLIEGINHSGKQNRSVQKKVFKPFLLERDSV